MKIPSSAICGSKYGNKCTLWEVEVEVKRNIYSQPNWIEPGSLYNNSGALPVPPTLELKAYWCNFKLRARARAAVLSSSASLSQLPQFSGHFLSSLLLSFSVPQSLNRSLKETKYCWFSIKNAKLCSLGWCKLNANGIRKRSRALFCRASSPLSSSRWVLLTLSILCPLFLAVPSINLSKIKIILGNAENQTQGCWVRSKNATSVLCSSHMKGSLL